MAKMPQIRISLDEDASRLRELLEWWRKERIARQVREELERDLGVEDAEYQREKDKVAREAVEGAKETMYGKCETIRGKCETEDTLGDGVEDMHDLKDKVDCIRAAQRVLGWRDDASRIPFIDDKGRQWWLAGRSRILDDAVRPSAGTGVEDAVREEPIEGHLEDLDVSECATGKEREWTPKDALRPTVGDYLTDLGDTQTVEDHKGRQWRVKLPEDDDADGSEVRWARRVLARESSGKFQDVRGVWWVKRGVTDPTTDANAARRALMEFSALDKDAPLFVDGIGRHWVLKERVEPVEMLTADQRRAIMHEELAKQGRGAVVIDGERRSWSVYMHAPDLAAELAKTDLEIAEGIVAEHLTTPGWFADAYGQRWEPEKNKRTDMQIAQCVLALFDGKHAEFWDAKHRSWTRNAGRFGHAEVLELLAGNNPDVEYRDRRGRLWVCVEETGKVSEPHSKLGKRGARCRRGRG